MSEDDVKALADSYKGLLVKIQYHNDEGIISVTGVLTEESREALARVALEFCKERNNPWKPVAQFLKRAGAPVVKQEEPK